MPVQPHFRTEFSITLYSTVRLQVWAHNLLGQSNLFD